MRSVKLTIGWRRFSGPREIGQISQSWLSAATPGCLYHLRSLQPVVCNQWRGVTGGRHDRRRRRFVRRAKRTGRPASLHSSGRGRGRRERAVEEEGTERFVCHKTWSAAQLLPGPVKVVIDSAPHGSSSHTAAPDSPACKSRWPPARVTILRDNTLRRSPGAPPVPPRAPPPPPEPAATASA
jgi:hypothetical protein